MNHKSKVVAGIYHSRADVERTLSTLKSDSFLLSDISILMPKSFMSAQNSKANEKTELFIGGDFGKLVGVGELSIPGLQTFVAAGPMMTSLTNKLDKGIVGALVEFGIPEYEAKHIEMRVKSNGILFAVHTDSSDEMARVKRLFDTTGAEDVIASGEIKGETRDSREFTASENKAPPSN